MSAPTLARTLEAFFKERLMGQRHVSPHTVDAYRDTFKLLFAFVQDRSAKAPSLLGFEDIDAVLVGSFLHHLEVDRGNSARTRNVRLAAIHDRLALHESSPYTAIHEMVLPEAGDIIVRKTRIGAFSTTDLDNQLRARNVDTLLLAGITTSGVVLSTVRDGADRDYRILVIADLCADHDKHAHELLMGRLFLSQADVFNAADLNSAEMAFERVDGGDT